MSCHNIAYNKIYLSFQMLYTTGSWAIEMLRDLLRRVLCHVRAACGGGERSHRSGSTNAQLVDMMSTINLHNRLRDGSLKNATCARGTDPAKLNEWRGKSRSFCRFCFSRSLSRATSNEANEAAMLRPRVDHHRAPSGTRFVPNKR